MDCDRIQLALSARLDGEEPGVPDDVLEAHLPDCAACRQWLREAEQVTRTVRLQSVAVPDLTAAILASARDSGTLPLPGRTPGPLRTPTTVRLRWALGVLAALQLVLAVPDLLGGIGHDAHAGREVAAFDVALAVGLLIAAWYPEHARVFAPVVATLVLCFVTISAMDILQGVVSPGRVAVHMIAVAQAGLVWLLARAVAAPLTAAGAPATPRASAPRP